MTIHPAVQILQLCFRSLPGERLALQCRLELEALTGFAVRLDCVHRSMTDAIPA